MDTNGVVGAMIIDSDGLCLSCKLIFVTCTKTFIKKVMQVDLVLIRLKKKLKKKI